jgi:hypothetical protein
MKKILCIIVVMSSLYTARAQVVVEEGYLKELVSNSTIIYCSQDTLEDGQMIKKMELVFQDTTMFYSAYVSSASFVYEVVECDFIQFDDGGMGLSLTKEELDQFIYLQHKLDTLLQFTELIPYKREYVPWWYVEE